MISTQAMKNNIMELIPNLKVSGTNLNMNSSSAKRKDINSFDTLLSNRSVFHQGKNSKELEKVNSTLTPKNDAMASKKVTDSIAHTFADSTNQTSVKDKTITKVDKSKEANSDNVIEKLAKTIEEVEKIVLDTLKLTEEELISMMEVLSLTMMDLLNPEALKQLTLENAGTNDYMMLLTDEALNLEVTSLMNQVQTVLENSDLTQQELDEVVANEQEFIKLIEKLQKDPKDITSASDLQVNSLHNEDIANEISKENSDEKSNMATESSIEFSVERVAKEVGNLTENSSNSETNQGKEQKFTQVELTNQFLNQVVNSTQTVNAEFNQQLQQVSDIREIANQVIEKIKLLIKPSQTTMEMTLNPEHLGKVALNITSKDGVITATFSAQNQVTKEAIESQLQTFKENLINQGIKVEAIEVNVSNFSFEGGSLDQSNRNQQEAEQGKKTAIKNKIEDIDYLDDGLSELSNDTVDYGNNFDYSA